MNDHKEGLHAIWREAAEKGIAEGIDWPRVVLDLFKELDDLKRDRDVRSRAHSLTDCWCGMPHRRDDFL